MKHIPTLKLGLWLRGGGPPLPTTSRKSTRLNAFWLLAFGLVALTPVTAHASETINYSYDAKGRLVAVTHAGGPANNAQTTYAYDAADNRKNVTTIGMTAQSAPIVLTPFKGLTIVIPR